MRARLQAILFSSAVSKRLLTTRAVIQVALLLLNATVKSLCGKHIHLYRAFGMQGASVYEWQHQVDNPNSRVEQLRAVQSIFKFPKRYYHYYQSSEQHTHKLHFPAKLKRLLLIMFFVLAGVLYLFYRDGGLNIVTGGSALAPLSQSRLNEDVDVVDAALQSSAQPLSDSSLSQPLSDSLLQDEVRRLNYGWSSTPAAGSLTGCVAKFSKPLPRNVRGRK